jgi:hypothetical protein
MLCIIPTSRPTCPRFIVNGLARQSRRLALASPRTNREHARFPCLCPIASHFLNRKAHGQSRGHERLLTPMRRHFDADAHVGNLSRRLACSARSIHPKLFHRKNFIPRTDIIQNYRVGCCQTLNLRLALCRKDRQPPPTFGIIYRAVTHDRTNFGQALKVVAVSLHDVSSLSVIDCKKSGPLR